MPPEPGGPSRARVCCFVSRATIPVDASAWSLNIPQEADMRLVATEYLSLDGVFEEAGRWSGPFFNAEAGQFKWDELKASDALLLGRKTYEGFAAAWPKMPGTGEFGEKMNSMPKYVISSTLDTVEWPGSRLLKGDVVEEVRKLKGAPGNDLLLSGSAQLFN